LTLQPWQWWLVGAIVLAVVEMVTAGFFVIWFAIGCLAAMVASWLGAGAIAQGLSFVVVSGLLVLMTRPVVERLVFGRGREPRSAVDALPGQMGTVTAPVAPLSPGLVRVGGEVWTAVPAGEAEIPAGTRVRVARVEGVKLVVEPVVRPGTPPDAGPAAGRHAGPGADRPPREE
jgi:membrane protein implicated in regulation of membrane protease activity